MNNSFTNVRQCAAGLALLAISAVQAGATLVKKADEPDEEIKRVREEKLASAHGKTLTDITVLLLKRN